MSKVELEDGFSVDVHTRIRDLCRNARSRQGLTTHDISDLISERFGIDDFSINTINNFFSERSKASTIYTTGLICAVLDISLDAVFGIESSFSSEKEAEFVHQLAELKVDLRFKNQQIENLNALIEEKDKRIDQAHAGLEHYREESSRNGKKVQSWVFIVVLALLIAAVLFIIFYLLRYDFGNPDYGMFRG